MRNVAARALAVLLAVAAGVVLLVALLCHESRQGPGHGGDAGDQALGRLDPPAVAATRSSGQSERREAHDAQPSSVAEEGSGAAPAGALLRGSVLDLGGAPLAGARVTVFESGRGALVATAATDGAGRFAILADADAGRWLELEARQQGHVPERLPARAGEEPVTLVLARAVTLSLTVLAREDGAPLEGAAISFLAASGRPVEGGLTDAEGRAEVFVPEVLSGFRVSRIGFRSALGPGFLAKPGETIVRTLHLERSPACFVAVVDGEGRDVADPFFETIHEDHIVPAVVLQRIAGPPLRHEVSLGDGVRGRLRISVQGLGTRMIEVAEDEGRALDEPPVVVTLGRGATLLAQAVRDGRPCAARGQLELLAPGIEEPVPVDSWPAAFDAGGSLRIDGLPRGDADYRLVIRCTGSAPKTRLFRIAPDQDLLDLGTFDLSSGGGELSGTVRDESGRPLAGASVEVLGDTWTDGTVTGEDGAYRLPAPGTGCRLRVERAGFCTYTETLEPAASGAHPIVLATGEAVRGRVVDDRGEPVPFAVVSWRATDPDDDAGGMVLADVAGAFGIGGICRSPISLSAARTGILDSPAVHGVAAGSEVTLVAARAGVLRVRAHAPDGQRVPGPWRAMLTANGRSFRTLDAAPGEFEAMALRHAGPVGIQLHAEGAAVACQTAWVEPLGETLVDVALGPGFDVSLTFADAAGSPRAGVAVQIVHQGEDDRAVPFALPAASGVTDAGGRLRLHLQAGRYGIAVDPVGTRLDREQFGVAGPVDIEVRCLAQEGGAAPSGSPR